MSDTGGRSRRPIAAALFTLVLRPGAGAGAIDRPNSAVAAVGRAAELADEWPAARLVGADVHRLVGRQVVHDLRHTAATLAAATGASTKELMERMGHTSPRVALRYQHVMADRQAALAAALDDLARDATNMTRAESGGHVDGTTDDAAAGERASNRAELRG